MIIVFTILTFFAVDIIYQTMAFEDVNATQQEAAEVAMQKSIRKGYLRANETMAIDPEVFIEEYNKYYDKNQAVKNSDQQTKFYAKSSVPPMVALETRSKSDSFFRKYFQEKTDMTYTKKEIFIFEDKKM